MKKQWRKAAVLILSCLLLAGCRKEEMPDFQPDTGRIRDDTIYMCREIGIRVTGTDKEKQTADWIVQCLETTGYTIGDDLFLTAFEGAKGLTGENIIAVCNPDSDGPIFMVVAHYDSVATSPGARDNAASVAGLLEISRYLGGKNEHYPCQIRMVFLGSEENGYHGSRAYVESLSEEEKVHHAGTFNMDISAASQQEDAQLVCNTLGAVMEGTYREGNFIIPAEGKLVAAIRQAYREMYGRELGGVFHFGESDHVSFHNAGLEAANVCWRKVEAHMPVLPESYHKMEDTPEELDYETVAASIRCILKAIQILAS